MPKKASNSARHIGVETAALFGVRLGVRLAISGHTIYTLVDTGAAQSLMAERTFLDICQTTNRPSLLEASCTVCALGGHPLRTLGQTELRIDGLGPINVVITADLTLHH